LSHTSGGRRGALRPLARGLTRKNTGEKLRPAWRFVLAWFRAGKMPGDTCQRTLALTVCICTIGDHLQTYPQQLRMGVNQLKLSCRPIQAVTPQLRLDV